MTETAAPPTYRFDDFDVRPLERLLLQRGQAIAIGSRAFDLLRVLLEHAGELVTKDRLLDQAWPGLVVEEANLHVQVSHLRKLLGADAITTVPGLGYRFTRPLQPRVRARALPAARTRMVGREAVIADAGARLAATRLLTLIGIGGTGKTRLAQALAEARAEAHADGVAWVDLVPVEGADALPVAVAQALGCRLDGATSPVESLLRHLATRDLLLVLDNCEHLLDPAAALADRLLAEVPKLRVLATSREALDLPGEAILPVRPLELPAPGASAEEAQSSEALRLLRQAASLAGAEIEWSAAQVEAAVDVCRQLDGIPLALELAATQLRVLSLEQLRRMLGDRLRQLTGSRRAPPRQQTLAAVLQWSHDHLRAEDQRLLHRLAVCAGGCDLDAAEALVSDSGNNGNNGDNRNSGNSGGRAALLSGLARLVDQSLLTVRHGDGDARYVLLETVRQDALQRLQEADEIASTRDRHAAHFLAFAEVAQAEIERAGRGDAALRRLDAERDNLMRALDWWDRDDDATAAANALRLVVALRWWWAARGLVALGLQRTQAALGRAAAIVEPSTLPYDRTRGLALGTVAQMLWHRGEHERARESASLHAALAEAAGDAEGMAIANLMLGNVCSSLGRPGEARGHYELALGHAREAGLFKREGDALHGLASVAAAEGRMADAQRLYDDVLAMRRREPQAYNLATALANAASAALDLGDLPHGRSHLVELLGLLAPIGSRYLTVHTLRLAGRLLALGGRPEPALQLAAAAESMREQMQLQWDAAEGTRWGAESKALRERLGDAGFEAAWAQGRSLAEVDAVELASAQLGGRDQPARPNQTIESPVAAASSSAPSRASTGASSVSRLPTSRREPRF